MIHICVEIPFLSNKYLHKTIPASGMTNSIFFWISWAPGEKLDGKYSGLANSSTMKGYDITTIITEIKIIKTVFLNSNEIFISWFGTCDGFFLINDLMPI